jgi:hypothetical protein
MIVKEECPYRQSVFCVIGIHVAAVLAIKEHLELQIILVECAPLLYPIKIADVTEVCHRNPLRTIPDNRGPWLTWPTRPIQMSTKPS